MRTVELQRLQKPLSKAEYQKLNGRFYAFQENTADLNKAERKILRRFFEHAPLAK